MKEEHSLSEILLKRLDETTVRDLRKLNAVLFPVKYAVSRRAFHSLSLLSAMLQLFLLTLGYHSNRTKCSISQSAVRFSCVLHLSLVWFAKFANGQNLAYLHDVR